MVDYQNKRARGEEIGEWRMIGDLVKEKGRT